MFVIVGLGNPGSKYEFTRHNAGFLAVDYFCKKNELKLKAGKGDFYYAEASADNSDFMIVKPTTYMNLSGRAVSQILNKYKVKIEDVLIIYDDVNLPFAELRVRANGGDGGHNGLNSIIFEANSSNFPRIRIGVGNTFKPGEMADFVLSKFSEDEFKLLEARLELCSDLIEYFAVGGTKMLLDANSRLNKPKSNSNNPEDLQNG